MGERAFMGVEVFKEVEVFFLVLGWGVG